jgi:hypothetical protein
MDATLTSECIPSSREQKTPLHHVCLIIECFWVLFGVILTIILPSWCWIEQTIVFRIGLFITQNLIWILNHPSYFYFFILFCMFLIVLANSDSKIASKHVFFKCPILKSYCRLVFQIPDSILLLLIWFWTLLYCSRKLGF